MGKWAHEATTQTAGKQTEHDKYLLDSLQNARFMTHLWDKPVAGKRCNYELWSVQTCFKGRVHQFHQSRVEPEAFLDATFSPYFRPATRTVEMGEVCGTLWVQTKYYSQKRRLNICHHTLHISLFNYTHQHMHAYIYIYTYIHTYIHTMIWNNVWLLSAYLEDRFPLFRACSFGNWCRMV